MNFESGRSIYEQIGEYVQARILSRAWTVGDRLPSVRELAVTLGVNPNTAQRSYRSLQTQRIIYNQRGVGYFVAEEGYERTVASLRDGFERRTLPKVFTTMEMIGLSIDDVVQAWERFQGEKR